MASLTVLSSPNASTNGNTFLLTTAATTTVAKIAPKRSSEGGRSRRNSSRPSSPPSSRGPSVARRNERERNRVRQVNLGFATLRQHVPNRSKKMSKVETLRSAVQYIRQLQALLGEASGSSPDSDDAYCGGSDENCGGAVPAFAEAFARSQPHHHHLTTTSSAGGAGSPAPSLGSDASSPYDSLGPEDEELIDFTTWLS